MNIPKVSIIVPCYGVEKYLDRCMESLVNQTLRDIEIILVDDVSPDRVPEMCDEWVDKSLRGEKVNGLALPSIKVVHKEKNGGLGFARNTGLDVATGEYVAFVDSDDFVELNMYESLYNAAINESADLVFGGFYNEVKKGVWHESKEVNGYMVCNEGQTRAFMLDMIASAKGIKAERKYQMSVWHSIYRLSIIKDNNIKFVSEREVVSEDIPFQVDFLSLTKKMVYLPNAYYYYCLNGASLSATYKIEKLQRFSNLRSVLLYKIEMSDDAIFRINRLYLGYVRHNLLKLLYSDYNDKTHIFRDVCNYDIWNDISNSIAVQDLPLYPAIFYYLVSNKHSRLLWWFMNTIKLLK